MFAVARMCCVIGAALLFTVSSVRGEFYRYEDKDGTVHYVEDKQSIPPEYRKQKKVYREEQDDLPEEERQLRAAKVQQDRRRQLLQQDRQAEAQRQSRRQQEEEAARQALRRSLETPVVISGNQVFVPVSLAYNGNSTEAMLLLDTGASITLITPQVAERLQIGQVEGARVKGVGGRVLRAGKAQLSRVKAGPASRDDMPVVIVGERGGSSFGDGLLGMDFLRGFKYSVDFSRSLIVWEPQ